MQNIFSTLAGLGNFEKYPATFAAVVTTNPNHEPILAGLETLLSVIFALQKHQPVYNWFNHLRECGIAPQEQDFDLLLRIIWTQSKASHKGHRVVDHFNQVLKRCYIRSFYPLVIAGCVSEGVPVTILEEEKSIDHPVQIKLKESSDPDSFGNTELEHMLNAAMIRLKMLDQLYRNK